MLLEQARIVARTTVENVGLRILETRAPRIVARFKRKLARSTFARDTHILCKVGCLGANVSARATVLFIILRVHTGVSAQRSWKWTKTGAVFTDLVFVWALDATATAVGDIGLQVETRVSAFGAALCAIAADGAFTNAVVAGVSIDTHVSAAAAILVVVEQIDCARPAFQVAVCRARRTENACSI